MGDGFRGLDGLLDKSCICLSRRESAHKLLRHMMLIDLNALQWNYAQVLALDARGWLRWTSAPLFGNSFSESPAVCRIGDACRPFLLAHQGDKVWKTYGFGTAPFPIISRRFASNHLLGTRQAKRRRECSR